MASTDDCKQLLATDPLTKDEVGAWKRVSKKNGDGGILREFRCTSGATALVIEDAQGRFSIAQGPAPGAVCMDPRPLQAVPGRTKSKDPMAKAAAYLFALLYNQEEEQVFVVVVTKKHWAKNKYFMDSPLPIDDIMPGGAPNSPNESSIWETSGFTDATHLAQAMLDKGFEFSPELQAFCDNICPASDQSEEARKAIQRLRDIHTGKPVEAFAPSAARKTAGGTAEPDFTVIRDVSYLDALAARITANTQRDARANSALRNMADMQISLVVLPPPEDPRQAKLVDFLTAQYLDCQAYGNTVLGVEFDSPAHAHLNGLLGPLEACAVVGFQGNFRPVGESAEERRPTQIRAFSDLSARMVDVEYGVKKLFNPGLKPKWG